MQPESKRFTRSSLKLDGFRPAPVVESVRPKKKSRAKMLLVDNSKKDKDFEEEGKEHSEMEIPETPIPVLQRVGRELGIDPEKLSEDKLEAGPADGKNKTSDNE